MHNELVDFLAFDASWEENISPKLLSIITNDFNNGGVGSSQAFISGKEVTVYYTYQACGSTCKYVTNSNTYSISSLLREYYSTPEQKETIKNYIKVGTKNNGFNRI